ncbi:MAG: sulfite exporter TauE/SafE family protein [Candidatus Odinarchaeia archaeon]
MPVVILVILMMIGVGAIVGLVSSFFGVGACFIMVPVMIFVFDTFLGASPEVSPLIAFGTNMAIVVPTSISGVIQHKRKLSDKKFPFPTKHYVYFALFVGIGSAVGSLEAFIFFYSFRAIAGLILKLVFGLFCVFGAYRFITAKLLQLKELKEPKIIKYGVSGFFSGMLAHFMGIGGGLIYMPVLNTILLIPALFAVAISLGTMVIGSSVGAVSFGILGSIDQASNPSQYPLLSFGWFNLIAFFSIGAASIISAQFGPKLAHKTNPKKFKILLAIVYVYIGVRLIINSSLQLQGLPPLIP